MGLLHIFWPICADDSDIQGRGGTCQQVMLKTPTQMCRFAAFVVLENTAVITQRMEKLFSTTEKSLLIKVTYFCFSILW